MLGSTQFNILQKMTNMNELAIIKRISKLKVWYLNMPNFSYCHRMAYFKLITLKNENK